MFEIMEIDSSSNIGFQVGGLFSRQYPSFQNIRVVSDTCRLIAPKLFFKSEDIGNLTFLQSEQNLEREREKRQKN